MEPLTGPGTGTGPGSGMMDTPAGPADPMAGGLDPVALEAPPQGPVEPPVPEAPPEATAPGPMPPPAPADPLSAAIDSVLFLDPKEAIRRVYQLAASAARAKTKVDAAGDILDARTYHAIASQFPEVRWARELRLARQRLDVLAGERRRLAVDVDRGLKAGKGSGVLDAQLAAADIAMDQVARGVLLFLALPSPQEMDTSSGPNALPPVEPPA